MFSDIGQVLLALLLVLVNGFFVAAEFAFIKLRPYRLEELVRDNRPFARTAQWLVADGSGSFIASGGAAIALVNKQTGLMLPVTDEDTLSGFVTTRLGRMAQVSDRVEQADASIEVLEVAAARASKLRIHLGAPRG